MTKKELFLKLSRPDNFGISRWVSKNEFIDEFKSLDFNNGCPWIRSFNYLYETKKENKIWKVRLVGFKKNDSRPISKKIRKLICSQSSCHSGLPGTSNDYIIPDHKNGRYDKTSVLDVETQILDDFQPLTLRENLFKRQMCKVCKETNKRFDAKKLSFSFSFLVGDENYEKEIGCEGCYWYDCKKFKESLKWK
jgi:hypothetical protein